MLNFDEIFPHTPMEDLIDLILNILDENDELDTEDIKTLIYEQINKNPTIQLNKDTSHE